MKMKLDNGNGEGVDVGGDVKESAAMLHVELSAFHAEYHKVSRSLRSLV